MKKSNSSAKQKPVTQRYSLANAIVVYFLLVMFILFPVFVNFSVNGTFPFFFERGFYSIRHQKYYLFVAMAAIAVIAEVLLLFTEGLQKIKKTYDLTSREKVLEKISFTDWAVLAFVVTCAISTIFSTYKEMAFWGETALGNSTHGRNNGMFLMLIYAAVYFMVSRAYRYKENLFTALAITASAVYLISVLNCFYIDPLRMFVLFKDDEKVFNDFLTTIGNKNMFSTYICVTMPVAFVMSVMTKELWRRIVYLVTVGLGIMAMVACDSDSAVLGLGAFAAVFLVVFSRKIETLKKYMLGITVMLFSVKLLGLISAATGDNHHELGAFPYKLMTSALLYFVLAAAAVITGLLYYLDSKKPGTVLPKAVPVAIAAVFIAGAAGVLGAMIYFSNIDKETDLGSFERLLRFNPAWGTHRGIMWIDSMKIFGDASIFEKLFGAGPECFYFKFQPYFKDLYEFGDGSTDAAHNEYIQYLINVGVIGLASYLAFVNGAMVRAFKAAKKDPMAYVYLAAVVSYLAQAVVNIALPIGTPLFIIFIALCENSARQVKLLSDNQKVKA